MRDRTATIDDQGTGSGEVPDVAANHSAENLEQRVHRLEDAVAALQDTQIMEERITERVVGRIYRKDGPPSTAIVSAEQRTRPTETAVPDAAVDVPAPLPPLRRSWLIVEVCREIRTMIGMFFDSRYHVSWSAIFALMLLVYVLVSQWLWTLLSGVPVLGFLTTVMNLGFVGNILDKAVDLILALYAYKTLSREMARYRAVITGPAANYPHY